MNLYDATLAGLVLPVVISIINQTGWSTVLRSLVALAACLIAALVSTWGNLSLETITTTFGTVLVMTLTFYKSFYQPTGVAGYIEEKTSFDDE